MSFLTGLGPRVGGNQSALNLSVPTLIRVGGGRIWTIQVSQAGIAPGYFYDATALPLVPGSAPVAGAIYPGPANQILQITIAAAPSTSGNAIVGTQNLPFGVPGLPFPYFAGLVYVPGVDGMVVSVGYE